MICRGEGKDDAACMTGVEMWLGVDIERGMWWGCCCSCGGCDDGGGGESSQRQGNIGMLRRYSSSARVSGRCVSSIVPLRNLFYPPPTNPNNPTNPSFINCRVSVQQGDTFTSIAHVSNVTLCNSNLLIHPSTIYSQSSHL